MEGTPRTVPVGPPPDEPAWATAATAIAVLRRAGHEAWAVGGCVRDHLLGRTAKDVDVATSARPEQVETLFAHTIPVGKDFGVMIVVLDGLNLEVATFRSDGCYIDGRRPDAVTFATAAEDVHRRDFTINALLMDVTTAQVVDHVGGLDDLAARCLRAVGDAAARLNEDRLRVLRGLRFAAHLDLAIEPATWAAITSTSLAGLSSERLVQELDKGLAAPGHRSRWLDLLRTSGALVGLCPPVAELPGPALDELGCVLERLASDDPDPLLAAWLRPAPVWRNWLEAQPISRQRQRRVSWFIEHLQPQSDLISLPVAQRRRLLQQADAAALVVLAHAHWPDHAAQADLDHGLAAEIAAGPFQPLVRSDDLKTLGFVPGKSFGETLKWLEDRQLEGAFSTHAAGLTLARTRLTRP